MDFLQFLAFFFVLLLSGVGATGTLRTSMDPSLEIYKKMFEVKRREQLLALKNLAQLNDVYQQYKILDVMLKGLFKVCVGRGSSWQTQPGISLESVYLPWVPGLCWGGLTGSECVLSASTHLGLGTCHYGGLTNLSLN
uniref:Coiled-coil domain containing 134 n=1 Tax=Spermophilus dauricus TaxID=99837 RepID=A0A8C9UPR9_SPEDA